MVWPIPCWRQGGKQGAARARKGQSRPQRGILYQTASRLPVANKFFLGSWTVDIRREGRSQSSAPQRRHGTPEPGAPAATQETEWLRRGRDTMR